MVKRKRQERDAAARGRHVRGGEVRRREER